MEKIEQVKKIVLNQFLKADRRANEIIMMRTFMNLQSKLPHQQRDVFAESINQLIDEGYIIYEKSSPECLRLTQKGYDFLHHTTIDKVDVSASSSNDGDTNNTQDNSSAESALTILNQAIKKVPFVKYALGIAGIGAALAIITTFIEEDAKVPIVSLLTMLGLMVLLFIFSQVAKSKEPHVKNAGFILIYFIVFITCLSCTLLITSVFFDYPKPISKLIP